MKTELQEIILIARCIKEENKKSERLNSQCDRIEDLSNVVDSENYCKDKNDFRKCSIFKKSQYGCTICEMFIRPS